MVKWIRRGVIVLLLAVFLFSAASVIMTMNQYRADEKFYADAAGQYVQKNVPAADPGEGGQGGEDRITAPIQVDFERLRAVNKDVIGWIYCEDTVINYPVLQGETNDTYIHTTYEGGHSSAGSIFVDVANRSDFGDSNTIIYGHHMKDGSMFGSLKYWMDQEFYEEHPVMWLLTPGQDYEIVLFSGREVSAYSDTYTVFQGPGKELDAYLEKCVEESAFQADVTLGRNRHYVLLSTCAYEFSNARFAIHGMLVPVG